MNLAHRKQFYQQIEQERGSRVLAFITGERPGLETIIATDAVVPFVSLLDDIGPVPKLSLILHTNGGQTSAAWRLINLIRSFCDDLEVIVPTTAMSAGTLMALGANRIVMTKQGALGPIDPSLDNHPLAPGVVTATGHTARLSVSAEAVRGYIDEIKKDVTDPTALASVWNHLSSQIHPLVLGDIFRLGGQIRTLATDLIKSQVPDTEMQQSIIQLLCSDSGSHDYTINRRQATDMGLAVEKPSSDMYDVLREITKSYHSELQTFEPHSPTNILGADAHANYTLVRGLIESTNASYGFVSEGVISAAAVAPGGLGNISDQRTFEGWRLL